ncbi:MAG: chitobiase/beta-hexosaminidase C-terminal domain-containing protein [Clostridia bacterium]|nr:chitobiase/beta-hexosaminidase C-terminal domain-containing protein [Clostridia bacterium]
MQVKFKQNRIIGGIAAAILLFMLPAQPRAAAKSSSGVAALEINYEQAIVIVIGEDPVPRVSVRAMDASEKPVYGVKITAEAENKSLADVTAYRAITDKNGYSSFSVDGLAEGDTNITFRTADGVAEATMLLLVRAGGNRTARPTAGIGGYTLDENAPKKNTVTVPAGSQLTLSCETENAQIYYNLNDTCPCQDLVSRIPYSTPITVSEDSYFRITAYKPGLEYSERLNITVNVYIPGDVNGDSRVLADDARLALRASAGLTTLDGRQTKAADADGSGSVLADDARQILRYSAKLPNQFE